MVCEPGAGRRKAVHAVAGKMRDEVPTAKRDRESMDVAIFSYDFRSSALRNVDLICYMGQKVM